MQFISKKFLNIGNENILPIWQKVWSFLFLIGFSCYVIGSFIDPIKSWKFWTHIEVIHVALLILLWISFWDLILFFFKSFKSIKRLIKYVIIDEKIHELNSIKNWAKIILGILGLNLILIFFTIFSSTASQLKDSSNEFANAMKTFSAKIILASLIGFCGCLCWSLKRIFTNAWNSCSCTNIHKKIGYFMEGHVGVSKTWIFNISFMLFILLGFIGTLLGMLFWQHNVLSFLGINNSKLEISKLPLQISICALVFIAVIILCNHVIYIKKDGKFINYKMNCSNLSEKNVFDLVKTKRNINEIWWLNVWLMFLWCISAISLVMISDGVCKKTDIQDIFKYLLISDIGLMLLTLPMMMIIQKSSRKNLNKCLHIMDGNNKKFSELNFLN